MSSAAAPAVTLRVLSLAVTLLAGVLPSARAQTDVTWTGLRADTNWATAGNWTTSTVSYGSSATARFGATGPATPVLTSAVVLANLVFESGAQAYTITQSGSLNFYGAGVTNSSSAAQTITSTYNINLFNSASLANVIVNSSGVSTSVAFSNNATAANSTLNLGSNAAVFSATATAANATINLTPDSEVYFYANSTSGNATISNQGFVYFEGTSSVGLAHITTLSGGRVDILENVTAGSATFVTQAGGGLTLAYGTFNVGSVAGAGTIGIIGGGAVSVGGLGISTTVSGVISGDSSLVKTGSGTLTLSGANTYTGGTAISAGTQTMGNASALGTGTASIASGATLGGTGTVTGLVTAASGARLAPGGTSGTLTLTGGLTLATGAILDFKLGTASDQVVVAGGLLTGPAGTGGLTLNLAALAGFTAGTYTLIDFSAGGTALSSFEATDFALGTTPPGYTYNLAITGNQLVLTVKIPQSLTFGALSGKTYGDAAFTVGATASSGLTPIYTVVSAPPRRSAAPPSRSPPPAPSSCAPASPATPPTSPPHRWTGVSPSP